MKNGTSEQWAALLVEMAEGTMGAHGLELEPAARRLLSESSEASFQHGLKALGIVLSSTVLEKALNKHADALVLSADASNKYAARLSCATWVLVGATIALTIVAIAQPFLR